MSSSTDYSRSIHYISSSSDDASAPATFKVRLFHDYKHTAWLPKLSTLNGAARWFFITTTNDRVYKIQIIETDENLLLQRGWNLLAAIENLEEGDKLMFQIQGSNKLAMWIHSPPDHAPPIGFSPERTPPLLQNLQKERLVVNQQIELTPAINLAIRKVWNISSIDGHVYVCHLLISPSEGTFLIFNKTYSHLIPKEKASVAMRFIGSPIIMPGAIKTYRDGSARMVKEWPIYAKDHNLTLGVVFVCKIQRGPAVWEFVGSCAE